jgi:hypothetical protein
LDILPPTCVLRSAVQAPPQAKCKLSTELLHSKAGHMSEGWEQRLRPRK